VSEVRVAEGGKDVIAPEVAALREKIGEQA
jgi:hypothetical protein